MAKRKRASSGRMRGGRKRLRRSRRSRISRMPQIVPASKLVKLRYCDFVNIDPGMGGTSRFVFRANSLFDPNQSSLGHQPMGFDQWSVFYDHYIVIGSKCTATFISTGSGATSNIGVCGITLTDTLSSISNTSTTIMEQPNSAYKILTNSSARQIVTVRKGFSAKKFFGMKDVRDNRDTIGANVTTNPAEDAYFQVFVGGVDPDLIINPSAVTVKVTIDFTVIFSERKTLGAS